jgi:hypothetical protein
MTIKERVSLFRRRFSPLEERLIDAVRQVMPLPAQSAFDAQVAGITLVQRHPEWTELRFYRKRRGRVDWSDTPLFPRTGEFRLAEIRFKANDRRYKATLTSIEGHIFDFAVTPCPKSVAFSPWDGSPTARLLSDPMLTDQSRQPDSIPDTWRQVLEQRLQLQADDWKFHDEDTAYRVTFDEGEFLVLAERGGDEFVMHRIEPPASGLFFLQSHDGTPELINGPVQSVLRGK